MTTYAAIKLNKNTIISVLGHVADTPAGRERLVWALFNYPYQDGVDHYFIGGNYLKLTQPDYSRQILTRTELDLLFTYEEQVKKNGRRDPDVNWFMVTIREPNLDIVTELCSTW